MSKLLAVCLLLFADLSMSVGHQCYQCATKNIKSAVNSMNVTLWKNEPTFTDDCGEDSKVSTLSGDCSGQCMRQAVTLSDGSTGIVRGCVASLYSRFTKVSDGCHNNLKFVQLKSKVRL